MPTPRQMLEQRTRRLTLDIYGRRDGSRVADQVARVHAVPSRPVRVVAVEPLTGGRKMQAFYSTCHRATAEQVLTWYAQRWSIEQTFHDAKGHLGFEQTQGWTRRAVQRTAPTAMLLYSLIMLWFAEKGHRNYRAPNQPWYRSKSCASFADMLNTLRCESVRQQVLALGLKGRGSKNIMKTLCNASPTGCISAKVEFSDSEYSSSKGALLAFKRRRLRQIVRMRLESDKDVGMMVASEAVNGKCRSIQWRTWKRQAGESQINRRHSVPWTQEAD